MNFSEILNDKVNELTYAYSGNYDFGNLDYIGNERIISQRGVKILYKGTFRGSKIYVGKYVEIGNYILLLKDYIEEIPNSDIKINRYKVIGAMFVIETTIKEASIRTEKLNEDFNFVKMDKPDFAIVVDC